jgi:hypothetical protein
MRFERCAAEDADQAGRGARRARHSLRRAGAPRRCFRASVARPAPSASSRSPGDPGARRIRECGQLSVRVRRRPSHWRRLSALPERLGRGMRSPVLERTLPTSRACPRRKCTISRSWACGRRPRRGCAALLPLRPRSIRRRRVPLAIHGRRRSRHRFARGAALACCAAPGRDCQSGFKLTEQLPRAFGDSDSSLFGVPTRAQNQQVTALASYYAGQHARHREIGLNSDPRVGSNAVANPHHGRLGIASKAVQFISLGSTTRGSG